ncbi:flagellar basal body rod protein FlgC [Maricaulis salignorans]|uniref:Flagellar basal-body rod protein FlgC n=1 Tax=Maricaulis salignorans TaxID=144026 RepID=A0A1G9VIH0_9PROT|nr:flagellar basal body rod protein FlgC [Maricaulis salignorans]SDM71916.1 flagellar basal-body rod protein FlgC [Maricaulis salignorans]
MGNASDAMQVSASGMRAQAARMRIISENIANADSTAREAGGDPYQRQIPIFDTELDRASGVNRVRMTDVARDESEFTLEYDPGHPAADESGYVRTSNVSMLVEMMDMREALRSYEANLNMIENSRRMQERALDLLRR